MQGTKIQRLWQKPKLISCPQWLWMRAGWGGIGIFYGVLYFKMVFSNMNRGLRGISFRVGWGRGNRKATFPGRKNIFFLIEIVILVDPNNFSAASKSDKKSCVHFPTPLFFFPLSFHFVLKFSSLLSMNTALVLCPCSKAY